MGFLESLVRRQVRRLVSDAVDEVVDNTVGAAIRGAFENNGTEGTQNFSNNSNSSYTSSAPKRKTGNKASGEAVLRQRLEEVFAEEWSEYTVQQNMMSGVAGARNYSYGLYLNGVPKAMIMIITSSSHHNKKEDRLAAQASAAYGVPYMDFYSHLPNEKEYISRRLKENIL